MIKRDLLEKISSAKQMQKNNLQKALLLAKGITGEEDPVTVDYKACAFEKLLHENEAVLKKIVGNGFFSEIEALHRQWHHDYCKIYDLYYHHERGFISKWLGGNPGPTQRELELAGVYSAYLKEATWKIVHLLELVESRIENMKEEVF
jgi:hypothetical protein